MYYVTLNTANFWMKKVAYHGNDHLPRLKLFKTKGIYYLSTSKYMSYNYIDPKALHENLEKYVIIDVRDYDFDGKLINGALNVPFEALSSNTSSENKKLIQEHVTYRSDIVVHCMLSQVRGPKSVKFIKEAFPYTNILVLRGGYETYSQLYPQDIMKQ
eukprot:NODE_15_length_50561_cov_0.608081.p30 type:complete len:158 gc:universal NODE_15_length_50561_cov_0.608081:35187-35660(+)